MTRWLTRRRTEVCKQVTPTPSPGVGVTFVNQGPNSELSTCGKPLLGYVRTNGWEKLAAEPPLNHRSVTEQQGVGRAAEGCVGRQGEPVRGTRSGPEPGDLTGLTDVPSRLTYRSGEDKHSDADPRDGGPASLSLVTHRANRG